jgi:hypothetical protein
MNTPRIRGARFDEDEVETPKATATPIQKVCSTCHRTGHTTEEHRQFDAVTASETMPSPAREESSTSEEDIQYGMRIADRIFAKRTRVGQTRVEIHVDRQTLAAIVALAYSEGRKRGK